MPISKEKAVLKFPKTLGAASDLLYTLQQQRLAKAREVAELQEQETSLENHILINMLPEAKLQGARGNIGQISVKTSTQAKVINWTKFYAWIGKTKSWATLQQRPSITALREIWDNGKEVPGVVSKTITKLHCTKVS